MLLLSTALTTGMVGVANAQTPGSNAPVAAPASRSASYSFSIPPQPLAGAISAFSRVTGIDVVGDGGIGRGVGSPGVSGNLTPHQALTRLLAGTGLSYRFTNASTVAIQRPNADGGAGAAPAGAIALDTIDVQGATSSDPGRTEGTGSYTTSVASFGKNQTLKETPQTVSVITRQRIQDQGMTTMEHALERTPGITVTPVNTTDSIIYSRGFPVTNIQIDGNSPIVAGGVIGQGFTTSQFDLAMFDRVEVLRGSDALYGTSGAPGGAVNLVRKKPTKQFQMNALLHGGSWNNYRGELDVAGSLNENGAVRGRFVGTYQDQNFFYNHGTSNRYLLYGVIEADITDSTMLTFGANVIRQDQAGFFRGLPRYANGDDLGLPRSFSLNRPEDRWLLNNNTMFVRLDQELAPNWTLGVEASRSINTIFRRDLTWQGGINPATGMGLTGYDWENEYSAPQDTLDAVLKGSFHLLGREHKLTLGTNINNLNMRQLGRKNPNMWGGSMRTSIFEYNPADYPAEPYIPNSDSGYKILQKGVYGSFVAQVADPLKLIFGGRLSWYKYSYDASFLDPSGAVTSTSLTAYEDNKIFTPYLGMVYDLSSQWSAYASFAETYQPQAFNLRGPLPGTPLGPITGRTYEAGIKGSLLDGRLNTTFALYHIKRNGEGVRDFAYPATPGDLGTNCCWLGDGRIVSQGVDVEVSGQIAAGWQVQAGYTFNDNENIAGGGRYSAVTPKHLFKLWTTYDLQGPLEGFKIGGGVTAQSSFYQTGTFAGNPFRITEPGRAVVDLFAQYRLDEHWTLALNVNNLFDRTYYQAIGAFYLGNFYGAPRNFLLSARARF
ncbi:TonB-dependent siderophore receptor [Nitrobacter sp.]